MRNESKDKVLIRKVLSSEVAQVVAIVATLWIFINLVILPLNENKYDIEYIKKNHLAHIEEDIAQIKIDMKESNEKNTEKYEEIMKALAKIQGQLGIEK